jgi:hypothetical protein
VSSWHGLATVIAAGAGGTLDIVVGADMPDYSGAIRILTNTQVTIEGRYVLLRRRVAGGPLLRG